MSILIYFLMYNMCHIHLSKNILIELSKRLISTLHAKIMSFTSCDDARVVETTNLPYFRQHLKIASLGWRHSKIKAFERPQMSCSL